MTTSSQRWRERRATFRPGADEAFQPRRYEAGEDSTKKTKAFVRGHHYSGSCPNSDRFRYLLWRDDGEVAGAAVFGTPSGPKVLSSAFPFLGAPATEAVELQRLVLLDDVPANGESWFVSRCFADLKKRGIEAVVSFSDPMPRQAADGTVVMPGHVGVVYQALGAWYTGTSKQRLTWRVVESGRVLNERDLTKILAACPCCGSKRSTSGAGGAIERLVLDGASRPRAMRCYREWLCFELEQLAARIHHPGNHRYVWGLNKATKSGLTQRHGAVDPKRYPKKGP
jgi:hypothetical protein